MDKTGEVNQIIYKNITPVSEIGGVRLMEAVGRMSSEILSLTLRRGGGKCPECNGKGGWDTKPDDPEPPTMCLDCGGTGTLPEETKQLKDIIKEWEDGQD